MLTFVELLEGLAKQDVTLIPSEVQRMIERFGNKTLQMGTLNEDGSLNVPIDCIVEAVQSLGNQTLVEAVEGLRTEQFMPLLESVESLVERVSEARKRKIASLTRAVQNAPSETEAKAHWQKLQHLMFGI